MTDYRLRCEFDVLRRIGWSDEELGIHIDDVFERLRQSTEVRAIETEADLDTGRVMLDLSVRSWEPNRNMHARTILSIAIRAARARHEGILPMSDESKLMGSKQAAWSALRGATWRLRRADLEEFVEC